MQNFTCDGGGVSFEGGDQEYGLGPEGSGQGRAMHRVGLGGGSFGLALQTYKELNFF